MSVEAVWTEKCESIARGAAQPYYLPGAELEDLLQEARIGVLVAMRDWRPARGMPFELFAFVCARRMAITAVKKATRQKHQVLTEARSLFAPLGGPGSETVGDVALAVDDDPVNALLAKEELVRVGKWLSTLTPLERECVERIEIGGEAYEDVCDKKVADNALQRARRKLARLEPEAA